MFCKLIVVLVCLMGAALVDSSSCPAIVYGSNSQPQPAFRSISQKEFEEELSSNAKETMLVAFLAPDLNVADFSCSKSSTHESCFANLKGERPKTYHPNVEKPVEAMRQISSTINWANVDANGNLDDDVACMPGETLFIDLSNLSAGVAHAVPHEEVLQMQDNVISKAMNNLAKKCEITVVYTCTQSTNNIIKKRNRRASDTATSGNMFHSDNDFFLFYTDLGVREIVNNEAKVTPITITAMSLSNKNSTDFDVNMIGGADKLSFHISLSGGYYQMSNLMLNGDAYYVSSEVNSLTDFSYTCGNQTFSTKVPDSTKTIVWNSFQMQAPFDPNTPKDFKFGDPWYCVGFFSSGILAGLFVVFILLGIMSVGICWMLDINTMDRFDDPKGKTITINVSE